MTVGIGFGGLRCLVRPEIGGSVAALTLHGMPLLLPADLTQPDANTGGCFPLVPFSNRILDGRFRFNGKDVALESNVPGTGRVAHGHGWRANWAVDSVSDDSITMRYRHAAQQGWRWFYEARQVITARADRLVLELAVRNTGDHAMPAGLGWHPFFPSLSGTRVQVVARDCALVGLDNMPTVNPQAPETISMLAAGWEPDRSLYLSGVAQTCSIGTAAHTIVLAVSPPLGELVVHLPPHRDFMCVEPVSHRVGALNAPDPFAGRGAMRLLGAGETFTVTMEIMAQTRPARDDDLAKPSTRKSCLSASARVSVVADRFFAPPTAPINLRHALPDVMVGPTAHHSSGRQWRLSDRSARAGISAGSTLGGRLK